MEELLTRLEQKVKDLIEQHHHLKQSHQHLHSIKSQEKELFLAKQQKAIAQIETLVSKLKSIEKMS